jgi:hypothetical protein
MTRSGSPCRSWRRCLFAGAAAIVLCAGLGLSAPRGAWGQTAAPLMMGLSLGMPAEAAIRVVEAMAPKGSVTLPPMRRDMVYLVKIEAPVALAAPADEGSKDANFYVMLNSAPRILRSQPTRSSHVPFVTLVLGAADRRVVRIVFEPSFVYWPDGYDAARRTAWSLVELLRERHSVPVELAPASRPGQSKAQGAASSRGPDSGSDRPAGQAGWALRVNPERKSIVLTDLTRLPDAFATRLQLD